jgi:hypothetical protein
MQAKSPWVYEFLTFPELLTARCCRVCLATELADEQWADYHDARCSLVTVRRCGVVADECSKWLMMLMTPAAPRFPFAGVVLMLQVVLRQSLSLLVNC